MSSMSNLPPEFDGMRLHAAIPVPFTVLWRDDVPQWDTIDRARWAEAAHQRLCNVCGRKLGYWLFFIGSEESVQARVFGDVPMHEACARWSLLNCPWLASPPSRVALYVTRSYEVIRPRHSDHLMLEAAPAKTIEWLTG